MFDAPLTYAQSMNVMGIIAEIIGFLILLPEAWNFFVRHDKELQTKNNLRQSFKRLLFRYGLFFVVAGLLMQLLSVFVEANNFNPYPID